jgi:hypothetical protein
MIIHDTCLCGNDLWHWVVKDKEITLICTQCGAEIKISLSIVPKILKTVLKG